MDIKEKLKLLPDKPGCYLMKDKNGKIIYVGKAKILKNRVRSYFIGSHNAKTTLLVSEIEDFEYIITNNELECLILEINLIKQYDPKYNIKLTDDKTYPYILLTTEKYPRLIVVRNNKIKGRMFGPYPNVTDARDIVRFLNALYPFRKCRNLDKKECLYYHIHQCLAPCVNKIEDDAYDKYIDLTVKFLKGDNRDIVNYLEKLMNDASNSLEFEKAMEYRNLMFSAKKIVEKQKIDLKDNTNRDIFGYYMDEEDICIHSFFMRNGVIVAHDSKVFSYISLEVFSDYIIRYYESNPIPDEVLLPSEDLLFIKDVIHANIVIPKKGDKFKLINMAMDNAKFDLLNKRELVRNKAETKIQALNDLASLLNINIPYHIEAFDNSNILGEYAVSAMVVYKDGVKSNKDYRKYKIKWVKGANDYETMKEVIYRRYYRGLMENTKMPDLLVMDGGVIQVNAAKDILNDLNLHFDVIGLQKDSNHKADAIIYMNNEYKLDRHSNVYKFLSNISEEVHRFAISFHKDSRSKGMLQSALDSIDGVGKIRKEKLMKYFMGIENMKNGTLEEYKALGINEELYKKIIEHLKTIN